MKSKVKRKFVFKLFLLLLSCLLIGCGTVQTDKIELVVWGLGQGEHMVGTYAAIDAFENAHPDIQVITSASGRELNPQKLMTAIVGGVPPDVIFQDRFTIGGWASRDAFIPLDSFIVRDQHTAQAINPKDFYPATWNEATYEGKVYAVPYDVDVRVMYYNKTLLRQAGFVDAHGKVVPPKTWDDVLRYNQKLTLTSKTGGYTQVGFIPLYGPAQFYLFGWQNGGDFMSEDGRTCTLNDPKLVEALQWVVKCYDAIGGRAQVEGFQKAFIAGAFDPFLVGKLAMTVDGNWNLNNIVRHKPDMEFGVVPAPVPEGQPPITWSGGFSIAIPFGAKHPELAWEFIKWMSSPEAWRIRHHVLQQFHFSRGTTYIPSLSANKKVNEMVWQEFVVNNQRLNENYKEALRMCIDLLPNSKFRPVTPVGETLWDEHSRAANSATYHEMSPEEALTQAQKVVQAELDRIYSKSTGAEVSWWLPSFIALGMLVLGAFAYFLWKSRQLRIGRQTRRALFAGLTFISPWVIGFIIFLAVPIVASIVLSFTEYDVLHPARWVGIKNYISLIIDDPLFWKSLWNTTFMLLEVPLGMAVGLAVALLLNAKLKGIALYRTVFYLPAVVPLVASAILWIWILQPSSGLINSTLRLFGIEGPLWLQSPLWSKPSIILMTLWGAGSGMVVWLAGLQGIPDVLYEAAEIDGAGRWGKFLHVTLPMLSPYIFYNLVMGIIGTFQIFTKAYIMTQGGPVDSTLFYVYHLFNNAFRYFRMGYASAMAWILFIIILVFTLIQIKLSRSWVYYEEEGK